MIHYSSKEIKIRCKEVKVCKTTLKTAEMIHFVRYLYINSFHFEKYTLSMDTQMVPINRVNLYERCCRT